MHRREENWEGQLGTIPLFQLPAGGQPVNIFNMLSEFLEEDVHTRCKNQSCRQVIVNGRYETDCGLFTIISVNRIDLMNHAVNKKLNRLELRNIPGLTGTNLLGELI